MMTMTDVSIQSGLNRSGAKLFAGITESVAKYLRYRRTLGELDALSTNSLLDLDLTRGDLRKVARNAVYS